MIKKCKLVVGVLAASMVFFATGAVAEDVTSPITGADVGKLIIGTAADANDLTIGLSKGVEVRYVNPGDTRATAQWYVVASVHSGGSAGYGTAQNLTNIMTKKYNAGDATSTILTTFPLVEASKELWVSMDWAGQ